MGAIVAAATPGVLGVPSAHADPVVAATQHRFDVVQAEIRKLDAHAELVTERYDGVRWHLHRLHRQMLATAVRLAAAERQLAYQRAMLSQLLVQQYKSGDPQTLDIVMGASSLTQASNLADASAQLDASVTATVDAIRSARDSIVLQRADLGIERHHALLAERALARMRARLRAELRVRHRLARSIHAQLLAVMAAQRLHQARSALEATVWLQQDIRVDRPDPAQVMRDQVAIEAVQEVGVPYVWGGASPTAGFDCSGLAMWLYARHGIALPHFAASQYAIGRKVPIADMRPGDLVFFHHLGHVAVYIGEGYVVQAPHVGGFVEITPLTDPWLEANLVGATEPGAA